MRQQHDAKAVESEVADIHKDKNNGTGDNLLSTQYED